MVDTPEPNGKRVRSHGKRYPGASIPEVLELLRQIEAEAGSISTGLLATRLGTTGTSSTFKRLLASAKTYEFAAADEKNRAVVRLTSAGEAALGDDPNARVAALRRALILPEVFRTIARDLSGKQMPSREGLMDRFKSAGVAASAAGLAADNFLDSAVEASAAQEEGQHRIMIPDLPFDSVAAGPERQGAEAPGGTGAAKRSGKQGGETPRRDPPPPPPFVQPAPNIDVRIDVSGWDVDKVVELLQKIKSSG